MSSVLQQGFLLKYSRTQELEADRLVLEIQQREGATAAAERLRCALQRGCLRLSAP